MEVWLLLVELPVVVEIVLHSLAVEKVPLGNIGHNFHPKASVMELESIINLSQFDYFEVG